jgi:hypothetical protein
MENFLSRGTGIETTNSFARKPKRTNLLNQKSSKVAVHGKREPALRVLAT